MKKVLGVRSAPQQLRYALLERDGDIFTMLNASAENELRLPAGITDTSRRVKWVHDEVARILRQNPEIELVAIKSSEYGSTEDSSARIGKYFDAAVLLASAEAGVPVETKLYSQMATKRADVKRHAEERVSRTATGWNEQIADAIVVAWVAGR